MEPGDQDGRVGFSRRLNEVLDEIGVAPKHGGRQIAVAAMFGVSQKGARKWLEGEAIPHSKRLESLCTRLGVHVDWLLTGRGEKYARDTKAVADAPATYSSPTHRKLLALFEALPERDQAEVLRELERRKQRYDELFDELLRRRSIASG